MCGKLMLTVYVINCRYPSECPIRGKDQQISSSVFAMKLHWGRRSLVCTPLFCLFHIEWYHVLLYFESFTLIYSSNIPDQ